MSEATEPRDLLTYTFATWLFMLHVRGVTADDPHITDACAAVASSADEAAGRVASDSLVHRVRDLLGAGGPEQVEELARRLFGDKLKGDLGQGDRSDRTQRIRKYQFGHPTPWLARIYERVNDEVGPSWLLVQRVTDEVTAADPNPWNDVDEERHIPVGDFHVLWELDGCRNLYVA